MRQTLRLTLMAMLLGLLVVPAAGLWLRVEVEEQGEDATHVSLNLPMELVTEVVPLLEEKGVMPPTTARDVFGGSPGQWKEILQSLRTAREGEYVRVESAEEQVRIVKQGDEIQILVEEAEPKQQVRIRLPMAVAEAFAAGEAEELDLGAVLEALAEMGPGEIVRVEAPEARVRIWLAEEPGSEGRR
jgi:hypothetical protein